MTDTISRAFESIRSFHGTAQDNSQDWCDRAEIIFDGLDTNEHFLRQLEYRIDIYLPNKLINADKA